MDGISALIRWVRRRWFGRLSPLPAESRSFQRQYRAEFIERFERRSAELVDFVASDAVVRGNTSGFLK